MAYGPKTVRQVKIGIDEGFPDMIMILLGPDQSPVEPSKKASGIFHKANIAELCGGVFRKFFISPVSGQVQCIEGQV